MPRPPASPDPNGGASRVGLYAARAAQRAVLIPVGIIAVGITIGTFERGPLSGLWAGVLIAVSFGGAWATASSLVSIVLNRAQPALIAKLGLWLWLFAVSLAIGKGHLSVAGFSAALVLVIAWASYAIVAIGRGKPAA